MKLTHFRGPLTVTKEGVASAVLDGVLSGSSKAHRGLRRMLVDDHKLDGVVSLSRPASSRSAREQPRTFLPCGRSLGQNNELHQPTRCATPMRSSLLQPAPTRSR